MHIARKVDPSPLGKAGPCVLLLGHSLYDVRVETGEDQTQGNFEVRKTVVLVESITNGLSGWSDDRTSLGKTGPHIVEESLYDLVVFLVRICTLSSSLIKLFRKSPSLWQWERDPSGRNFQTVLSWNCTFLHLFDTFRTGSDYLSMILILVYEILIRAVTVGNRSELYLALHHISYWCYISLSLRNRWRHRR